MSEKITAGVWKHVNGPYYLVLGLASDSNNIDPRPETQVVYVSLDWPGYDSVPMHYRSVPEFLARFTLMSNGTSHG